MKTFFRIFTISDFKEEEEWLRDQSKKGLKLAKLQPPIMFKFEECEPEDVVYKLDYKNTKASGEYKQMYLDYGWEYCGECFGWNYFRKPAAQINEENEGELFSDNQSKLEMLEKIIKTRMLPLFCLFFCALIPSLRNILAISQKTTFDYILAFILFVLFFIYIFLFIHCGTKLNKLKKALKK